jgi:uncharacterized protein YeaO (DUF488 family)
MIHVKSIFADASASDGFRVLVEPVWPRKAPREKTILHVWLRDLAPSPELYGMYSRDLVKWEDFVTRYHGELERNRDFFRDLQDHNHNGGLTLVHGSRNEDRNTAVALKMFLENDDHATGSRGSG